MWETGLRSASHRTAHCGAILQARIPAAPWRPLVTKLGYSVGFLVVIPGRQQLFTENTLTPILPLLDRSTPLAISNVLRSSITVMLVNLVGALAIGAVIARTERRSSTSSRRRFWETSSVVPASWPASIPTGDGGAIVTKGAMTAPRVTFECGEVALG